ncbi:MAG TPA: BatD family protein [Chitinophagaceae bacterium]
MLPGLFGFLFASGQQAFRTIVPARPVGKEQSFQVQYVVENANGRVEFTAPVFTDFRLVSGPHIYKGSGTDNMVITLIALREGRLKIPAAVCRIGDQHLKSNEAEVHVTSTVVPDTGYYLKPGEDPLQKIHKNLFLRVDVDKKSCYVGEPVVATFKLYSRLQSRSNVVKNPAFYGFSVFDMVEANDQVSDEEKVNGAWFDVHVVRKVQLYPLEAGIFNIDPMQIDNKVEFAVDVAGRADGSKVTEHMYNQKKDEPTRDSREYELTLSTAAIPITVHPLPSRDMADTFEGAVGNFTISAGLARDTVLRNAEDSFYVEISGSGNFQRVNAPHIQWPAQFEHFDPKVTDTFDKSKVPMTGQRRFRYVFVSSKPGVITLPPASFTFFDITRKKYRTVSTDPFSVFVSARPKSFKTPGPINDLPGVNPGNTGLLAGGIAALVAAAFIAWWWRRKKRIRRPQQPLASIEAPPASTIDELLQPAALEAQGTGKSFYDALPRAIWQFLHQRFDSPGAIMTKMDLSSILEKHAVDKELRERLIDLLHQCETSVYTSIELLPDRQRMLNDGKEILTVIDRSRQ